MSKDLEAQRARADARFKATQAREAMAAEREREEAARVASIDEKTARLRALRLARDAEVAAAPAPAKRVRRPTGR